MSFATKYIDFEKSATFPPELENSAVPDVRALRTAVRLYFENLYCWILDKVYIAEKSDTKQDWQGLYNLVKTLPNVEQFSLINHNSFIMRAKRPMKRQATKRTKAMSVTEVIDDFTVLNSASGS